MTRREVLAIAAMGAASVSTEGIARSIGDGDKVNKLGDTSEGQLVGIGQTSHEEKGTLISYVRGRHAVLENSQLRFDLNLENLQGQIIYKPTGDEYSLDIYGTAGVQIGEPRPKTSADSVVVKLESVGRLVSAKERAGRIILRFDADGVLYEGGFRLDGSSADLVSFIRPITFGSRAIVKASFPGAIAPKQKNKVKFVVPVQQGLLIEEGKDPVTKSGTDGPKEFAGVPIVLQSHFWGVLGDKSSIAAILETFCDSSMQLSGGRLSRPVWESSLGHLRYERTIRYRFLSTGSYVDMAKAYRSYAESAGFVKTLKEKALERPILQSALGACYVFFGFYQDEKADYMKVLREIKRRGIDKAFCTGYAHGVNPGNVWIPGVTNSDIRKHREEIRKMGYLFGAFINHQLMADNAPTFSRDGLLKPLDGEPKPYMSINGLAEYDRCREIMDYDNVLYEGVFDEVDFVDHDQAIDWMRECYNPLHPHDHRQALQHCINMWKRALDHGLMLGGEAHDDCRIPYFDFMRTKALPLIGKPSDWMGLPNKAWTIPMCQLMFHDCFLYTWWEQDAYDSAHLTGAGGHPELQSAQDALFADPPLIMPAGKVYRSVTNPDNSEITAELIGSSLDNPLTQKSIDLAARVCRETGKLATEKMLSHSFLDEEGYVQQTRFESGARVIANFGSHEAEAEGTIIPPQSWKTLG